MRPAAARPPARRVARFDRDSVELAEYREAVANYAEARRGRKLSPAERHLDLIGIDRELERGKAQLATAVEKEKVAAIRLALRGEIVSLVVTPEMRKAIARLYDSGKQHARAELESLGYDVPRSLAALVDRRDLEPFIAYITHRLVGIGTRVNVEAAAISQDLGFVATAEAVQELSLIPGPLDLASRIVSSAFYGGRGEIFGTAADVITGWEYTAVMDDSTCPVCEELDGSTYDSWEEIQDVLPNGGPNPECDGNGRCRCCAAAQPPG